MKKQAHDLYFDIKKTKGLSVQRNLVDAFYLYLLELSKDLANSRTKNGFIIRNTFKTSHKNELDLKNHVRANIISARCSFKRFTDSIDIDHLTPIESKLLIDYICDLKKYINFYDNTQDYSWMVLNTNSHVSNFYYSLAKNVFSTGKPSNKKEEISTLHSSTPFFIRQSIEYKIKRILGIDYWTINGKPDLHTVRKCFKILGENKELFDTRNLDFKLVEIIYSWTNKFIHGGYRADPWQTETALNYLSQLFHEGELSQETGFSLYAGVESTKEDIAQLTINVKERLIRFDDTTKIWWLDKPEIAIVKKRKNG